MIILYSTHCPLCEKLKQKLIKNGIDFIENDNKDEMLSLGFNEVPVLKIENGSYLSFKEAIKYLRERNN